MKYLKLLVAASLTLSAKSVVLTPHTFYAINKVCKNVQGGDTIYLKGGFYSKSPRTIKCSGEENLPLTIASYPGEVAIIKNGLKLKGNWLRLQNLHFRGNSDKFRYTKVIQQWWHPSKALSQKGLLLQGKHIVINSCAFGNFPAAGLKITGKSDDITIKHSIIYNNAWWSTAGTGGLVIKNIRQGRYDAPSQIRLINNLFFGNESRIISHVFSKGYTTMLIDEGYSFLVQEADDAAKKGAKKGNYNGKYIAKNNLILFNGKGLSINKADNVELMQNFLYCNGTTASSPKAAGVRVNSGSREIRIVNNGVETCDRGIAYSIATKKAHLENNYAKSQVHIPIKGVKYVHTLFKNPQKLDFTSPYFGDKAAQLLASFKPLLTRYHIRLKPTHYRVNLDRQINDIIKYAPKTSKTKIIKKGDAIYLYNLNNRGIKGLKKNYILYLHHPKKR